MPHPHWKRFANVIYANKKHVLAKIIFSSWIHQFSKWWRSIFIYTHTHIYRTFLSKKDHKDNKQTYCSAKDPRNFLHRPGQNYARGQWSGRETVRTPCASWKTFPSMQKCRQPKNEAALKRGGIYLDPNPIYERKGTKDGVKHMSIRGAREKRK